MRHVFTPPAPFATERGEAVPDLRIAYRTWGRLAPDGANAVVVGHALTGTTDAAGWWGGLVGPGRPLNPARHFIVCAGALGACDGTTGPGTLDARGRRLGTRFPRVSIRDMARAHALLLRHLGVTRVALAAGGSMGGMQMLELALVGALGEADPGSGPGHAAPPVDRLLLIGMGAAHSPWQIGISEAQRLAVAADPRWCGGDFDALAPPVAGLAAARAAAMMTYRSPVLVGERFGRRRQPDGAHAGAYAVESYLRHQGRRLVERFDAGAYVRLTEAMDDHDVDRGRAPDPLARLAADALCVGIASDVLYPPGESEVLAARLPRGRFVRWDSPFGHDAFLADAAGLARLAHPFFLATDFLR